MNSECLHLYPVSYSKHKTVEKIRHCLFVAPKQEDNSPEAWDGYVFELRTAGYTLPGTLREYHDVLGVSWIVIHCEDGDVEIKRQDNGVWSEVPLSVADDTCYNCGKPCRYDPLGSLCPGCYEDFLRAG